MKIFSPKKSFSQIVKLRHVKSLSLNSVVSHFVRVGADFDKLWFNYQGFLLFFLEKADTSFDHMLSTLANKIFSHSRLEMFI